MKFIANHLGAFLVAAVAVALIITALATLLLPAVTDFISDVFPSEKNYVVNDAANGAPVLTVANEEITVQVGNTIDIFENITAVSHDNVDLKGRLEEDYAKDVQDRECVFIYRNADGGVPELVSEIDTSVADEWLVCFVLSDNGHAVSSSVRYVVVTA